MLSEIFGPDGLVVVVIIAVLLFGGAAIPKLARHLGSAKNEFERGLKEGKVAADQEPAAGDVTGVAFSAPAPQA
jgi:TatA/E family protein of Tat protein translocase